MPNDNKQQTTTAPPIIFTEDALPPMPQENSGSAAPLDDIVMSAVTTTSPTPKKKFAGGKIIATILGLFLLVGGIGAGVFLVGQNQDIRERAGGCRDDSDCDDGQTCNKFDRCEGGSGGGGGIYSCGPGSGDGCEGKSNGDSCGGEKVCKVRENGNECSCVGPAEPTVAPTTPPTVAPTTPPSITAYCQNIKAYSSTWALLTNTQLSALTTDSQVNFCVMGSASDGTFDKARFTINGVVQPETTLVRPGSTDFCQSYTVPANTTTFNITAQIHHMTLGWK